MPRSRMVLTGCITACLLTLAGALSWVGAQTTAAQAPPLGVEWQKVPGAPPSVDFREVFMATELSGVAVGKENDRGALYNLEWTPLDGWRWSLAVAPVTDFTFRAPLWSAVMVNEDIWAVGEQGLIVHKTATGWSEVQSPVPDAQLLTLQMLGNGEEGWAGGFLPGKGTGGPRAVLLHYTNGQWRQDDSITGQGTINALHFAQGGGWAVGSAGIWHYRRGAWTKEEEPDTCPGSHCFQDYNAVRAITADEGWIAGDTVSTCGICVPSPLLLHFVNGRWQVAINGNVAGDPTRPGVGRELYGLTFTDPNAARTVLGWAVGNIDGDPAKAYIAANINNTNPSFWQYVPAPEGVNSQLTSISTPDNDHVIAVGTNGTILSLNYGPQPPPTLTPTPGTPGTAVPTATPTAPGPPTVNPALPVSDPHNPNVTYFAEVGHTLGGGFRNYWQEHGGLAQFGYPITEEFTEKSPTDGMPYVTQYFERARFEYHPENKAPYDVLLGLLGRTITRGRESEQPFRALPPNPGKGNALYFPETGHFMDANFVQYWQSHGGLAMYGYPISEAFTEVSPTDGKPYLVQYFERNRLEYHPELPEQYRVSLGLLGAQILRERGWIK